MWFMNLNGDGCALLCDVKSCSTVHMSGLSEFQTSETLFLNTKN